MVKYTKLAQYAVYLEGNPNPWSIYFGRYALDEYVQVDVWNTQGEHYYSTLLNIGEKKGEDDLCYYDNSNRVIAGAKLLSALIFQAEYISNYILPPSLKGKISIVYNVMSRRAVIESDNVRYCSLTDEYDENAPKSLKETFFCISSVSLGYIGEARNLKDFSLQHMTYIYDIDAEDENITGKELSTQFITDAINEVKPVIMHISTGDPPAPLGEGKKICFGADLRLFDRETNRELGALYSSDYGLK